MHYALLSAFPGSTVVRSFDLNPVANDVYLHTFGQRPWQGDITSVPVKLLEGAATSCDSDNASSKSVDESFDIWMLAPPCQPYTRRGLRRGIEDERAGSFLTLIRRIPSLKVPPQLLLIENVVGFENSETAAEVRKQLCSYGYVIQEWLASPADLGIPYCRPRYFCLAKRQELCGPIAPGRLSDILSDTPYDRLPDRQSLPRTSSPQGSVSHFQRIYIPESAEPVAAPKGRCETADSHGDMLNNGPHSESRGTKLVHSSIPETPELAIDPDSRGRGTARAAVGPGSTECLRRALAEYLTCDPAAEGVPPATAPRIVNSKQGTRSAPSMGPAGSGPVPEAPPGRHPSMRTSCARSLPAEENSSRQHVAGLSVHTTSSPNTSPTSAHHVLEQVLPTDSPTDSPTYSMADSLAAHVSNGDSEGISICVPDQSLALPSGTTATTAAATVPVGLSDTSGRVTDPWGPYWVSDSELAARGSVLSIVGSDCPALECFTRTYGSYSKGCGSVLATENLQLVPVIAAALRKKRSEACPGVKNHVTALPERHSGAAVTDSSCNSGRTSYGALRGATTKAGATLESPSPGRVSPSVIDDADHEAAMKLLGLERGQNLAPTPERLLGHLRSMRLRFFTPAEVAALHGFPRSFRFPENVTMRQRYALLGNSLSIDVVAVLLRHLVSI